MTKSKGFWALFAAICLAAVAFSGYLIYDRLSLYLSSDTLEASSKPVPMPPDMSETKEDPAKPSTATTPESPAAAAETAGENAGEPQKIKAIKTVFEYKNAAVKSVSLAGSFTKWKEIKMAKKKGVWRAEVYILPGNYLYHFVADGKKKLDPGKTKAPVGESIVIVETEPADNRK